MSDQLWNPDKFVCAEGNELTEEQWLKVESQLEIREEVMSDVELDTFVWTESNQTTWSGQSVGNPLDTYHPLAAGGEIVSPNFICISGCDFPSGLLASFIGWRLSAYSGTNEPFAWAHLGRGWIQLGVLGDVLDRYIKGLWDFANQINSHAQSIARGLEEKEWEKAIKP